MRWLNIADWIAFRLSGEAATDYSLASRTLALDLTRRAWAADMLAEIGLTADLFAPLKPSGSALGPVRADVAAALGLPAGVIVGVGGHDHVCGAMAAGAAAPGILLDSMGTAEALYLPTAAPRLDPVVLARGYAQGTVAVDAPHFYLMGGIHHAGGAIEWFRQTLADGADHAALIEAAAEGAGGQRRRLLRAPPAAQPNAPPRHAGPRRVLRLDRRDDAGRAVPGGARGAGS